MVRTNQKLKLLSVAVASFMPLALTGCGAAKATNGTLVQDSTGTGASTAPTSANFTLGAAFSLTVPSYMHNAASSDWSGACQVPASSIQYPPVSSAFIGCYLEVAEADLYFSGITLQYSVPAGACDYLEVAPYYSWQYQPNIGAKSFTANVNANGVMTLSNSSVVPGNSALSGGVKVVNNTAVCQYDYTHDTPAGPNCCPGTYAETLITTDSTGGQTTTSTTGSWGGAIGNCAAGPAVEFAAAQTVGVTPGTTPIDLMPKHLDISAGTGYAGSESIAAPFTKSLASVVYNANYIPSLTSAPGALVAPAYQNATASTTSTTGNFPLYPNPYYAFTCYTHGYEAKGRILLQIRKWNLASELAKGSTGNWNSSGTEADPQYPNQPVDDINGWQDFSADNINFPGGAF